MYNIIERIKKKEKANEIWGGEVINFIGEGGERSMNPTKPVSICKPISPIDIL